MIAMGLAAATVRTTAAVEEFCASAKKVLSTLAVRPSAARPCGAEAGCAHRRKFHAHRHSLDAGVWQPGNRARPQEAEFFVRRRRPHHLRPAGRGQRSATGQMKLNRTYSVAAGPLPCPHLPQARPTDMAFSQQMVENFKEAFSLFDKKGQGQCAARPALQ